MAFEGLAEKLQNVMKKITGRGKLSEADVKDAMREVRLALLEADVNYLVVKDFIKKVSERAIGQEVLQSITPGQQVIKIVHDELCALMGANHSRLTFSSAPLTVYMLCGLQGAGKTTMAGKLSMMLQKQQGKRPMLAACDIYRPAAIQQLQVVGEKAGVPVFQMGQTPPVEIAKAAVNEAERLGKDVLILDTAGRLHIDEALMDELAAIKAAVKPQEILLVADAMTGQDAVNVSQTFNEKLGLDGVVVSKLDGDTRGGAALSIRAVTGKPIKFASIGEKLEDLEAFHPERMASRILGMGDVLSLIEKAQENFDEKQALEMERKMKEASFTLEDFLDQFQQVKKMGGLGAVMSMLPGMNQYKAEDADEKNIGRMEAIIRSMTPKERRNADIISASRRKRIARGSGTQVQDVNQLLRQFEATKKLMKQFSSKGGKRNLMRQLGGYK